MMYPEETRITYLKDSIIKFSSKYLSFLLSQKSGLRFYKHKVYNSWALNIFKVLTD